MTCPHRFGGWETDVIDVSTPDCTQIVPGLTRYYLNGASVRIDEYRAAEVEHTRDCEGNVPAANFLRELHRREDRIAELERQARDLQSKIGLYEEGVWGPDPNYDLPWWNDDARQEDRIDHERKLQRLTEDHDCI